VKKYELVTASAPTIVGARIEFTTEQIAELIRATTGAGTMKGAWFLLLDAAHDLGLPT
jgi:hypothetical protein